MEIFSNTLGYLTGKQDYEEVANALIHIQFTECPIEVLDELDCVRRQVYFDLLCFCLKKDGVYCASRE